MKKDIRPMTEEERKRAAEKSEKNSVNEDAAAVSTASIPSPADTAMGPRFKPKNVTDRRRKKQMVLLKRFRKHMEENG